MGTPHAPAKDCVLCTPAFRGSWGKVGTPHAPAKDCVLCTPALGGVGGRWGHPTPRQRTASSALLLSGGVGGRWGHPTPRQRTASSALLLSGGVGGRWGHPTPRQRTASSALLLSPRGWRRDRGPIQNLGEVICNAANFAGRKYPAMLTFVQTVDVWSAMLQKRQLRKVTYRQLTGYLPTYRL